MKRVYLAMAILCLCAASAQAQSFVNGIGVSVGVVDVENMESTNLGFGIFADVSAAAVPFSFQPYIDYWSNSEDVEGAGEFKTRDIAVGARALYNIGIPNPAVKPFVGAGLGMHFFKAETPALDVGGLAVPSFSASDEKLGIDLGGGLGFDVGRFEIRGEGWYTFVENANMMGGRAAIVFPFGM